MSRSRACSHQKGVMSPSGPPHSNSIQDSSSWVANVSADLKYSLAHDTVEKIVSEHGLLAPKGPAGSALFFHPNLVHGSAPNISPYDRTLVLITYNSVENIPNPVEHPRPEFLVARNHKPIVPQWDLVKTGHRTKTYQNSARKLHEGGDKGRRYSCTGDRLVARND